MELGSQFISIPVMILWAYLWPSVWALVAGTLVSSSVRMIWTHHLQRGRRNRLHWDGGAAREVIHFGKWIFAMSALGFLASQVDRLLLGKLIPLEMLGVYAISFALIQIPDYLLGSLGNSVLFPAITRGVDLPRDQLRATIRRNRRPLLAALAAAVVAITSLGDIGVYLLYDERYRDAGWMLQILALGLWPRIVTNTIGPALLAIGQPRYIAYSSAARFAFLTIAVLVGHAYAGMLGVVIAVAVGSLTDYVVESWGLHREGLWLGSQDLRFTLLWLALIAGAAAVRHLLGLPITDAPFPS
jgi:O-antigen/teichoic acid export membrane protein